MCVMKRMHSHTFVCVYMSDLCPLILETGLALDISAVKYALASKWKRLKRNYFYGQDVLILLC